VSTRQTAIAVERLLADLPAGAADRLTLQKRAIRYADDCGCKLGAVFLAVALVAVPTFIALRESFGIGTVGTGLIVVFAAAAVGKATGLLLAWTRLALLRRSLTRRLRQTRIRHV